MNSVNNATSKEMQFYETESSPELGISSNITEAFAQLIEADKKLHNKILRYEPVDIEVLHSTLRAYGFRCKLSNLMNFLDEQVHFHFLSLNLCNLFTSNKYILGFLFQCITFYVPKQNAKNRRRKKM